MAKNISLLGADYPNVPAVQLPQTGGGTATFYDINVIDNLNSESSTDALSANQGRVLNNYVSVAETATGIGNSVSLTKVGKIAMISFENSTAFGKAENAELFTIPSGFRPITAISFLEPLRNARISIYTNGKVYCSLSTVGNVVRGAFTYIIA